MLITNFIDNTAEKYFSCKSANVTISLFPIKETASILNLLFEPMILPKTQASVKE